MKGAPVSTAGPSHYQMGFAFSEVLAHVNTVLRRGDLVWTGTDGDIMQLVSA
jgi:2-keto-4-pentenoate hydratase/2-oxohepta-3-ene-1,7-dioic acid hydratase in catechol pathway